MPVVYVDKAGKVAENDTVVIYVHAPDPTDPATVIIYVHAPDLGNTAVVIVIYGDVLHLDHGTIVVVLNIGLVIVSRVEGDAHISDLCPYALIHPIVHIEVEFPIRVYRKGDPVLDKDE